VKAQRSKLKNDLANLSVTKTEKGKGCMFLSSTDKVNLSFDFFLEERNN
jgi:hypothetical protein